MANMDKVIVRSHKQNTYTGVYPYKNSGTIARADNDAIAAQKTFKNVKFIEDAWPFPKTKAVRSERNADYVGTRNHTTEEQ